ncbi:MAG: hypothetical protein ACHQK9_04950 [Reyranellales bacterium]
MSKASVAKSRYLFVYDYGTGGVWGIMHASSKEEIKRKYPKLKIVDGRPSWMSDADYKQIEARSNFDIDDVPSGWLIDMIRETDNHESKR